MAREKSGGGRKRPEDSEDHGHDLGHGHDQGHNFELDLDLDKRRDGIDLDVDVDRHGKWLEIDVEFGGFDLDLKVDARHLQPDNSSTAALIGGEGNAVGEQTLVDADIFSRLIDLGDVTVAFGTATFKSVALTQGDLVFAGADTFADISGADIVIIFNDKTSATSSKNGTSFAGETSKTGYLAIDF